MFAFLAMLVGCPSTHVTGTSIDEVSSEDDLAAAQFRLKVTGRGFGLKSVQFDVSKREGTIATAAMSLELRRTGVMKRIDQVEIESPRVLYAQVVLSAPLESGYYDVALFQDGAEIATKAEALFIPETIGPPTDGGGSIDADPTQDADLPAKDAETLDGQPPIMDGDVVEDGGTPMDAEPQDTGDLDGGVIVPDSGLGPFQGAYGYRQLITPTNTVVAPAGATILIPVPHQSMLAAGTALSPDGSDLAVYQGPDLLQHQWEDQFVVGSDALIIVAKLLRDLPIGGDPNDPLVLYSGDANATPIVTDAVFQFAERFFQPVGGGFYEANNWGHCNVDRPNQGNVNPGAYCHIDLTNSNLSRQTFASPVLNNIVSAPGANLIYEMSVWQAGRTVDGASDILYFAYGPQNDVFDNTIDPDLTAWTGFVPNGTLTFTDTDNQPRTVNGWRHPPDVVEWWQRSLLRWVPIIDSPTLHFRYVSLNANTSNASFSAIDDWWVRLAVEPDFVPTLGPVEPR